VLWTSGQLFAPRAVRNVARSKRVLTTIVLHVNAPWLSAVDLRTVVNASGRQGSGLLLAGTRLGTPPFKRTRSFQHWAKAWVSRSVNSSAWEIFSKFHCIRRSTCATGRGSAKTALTHRCVLAAFCGGRCGHESALARVKREGRVTAVECNADIKRPHRQRRFFCRNRPVWDIRG